MLISITLMVLKILVQDLCSRLGSLTLKMVPYLSCFRVMLFLFWVWFPVFELCTMFWLKFVLILRLVPCMVLQFLLVISLAIQKSFQFLFTGSGRGCFGWPLIVYILSMEDGLVLPLGISPKHFQILLITDYDFEFSSLLIGVYFLIWFPVNVSQIFKCFTLSIS